LGTTMFSSVLRNPTLMLMFSQTDSVTQSPSQKIIQEGQDVTLDCSFTTSDSDPYLYWYRQEVNKAPQMILHARKDNAKKNRFVSGKFSTVLFLNNKTVPLTVEGASLQDGAAYYCALSSLVRI
uniref:Ig-like domain-containing protein n=1 Tax=Varanus komodoensis TaxID=61221 RepID=A0A8D2L8M5_VARKO